jgi:NAD(P) transhydrogenase subunit alpha
MAFVIGVARETEPGENRVSMVPEVIGRLKKKDFEFLVEAGAGESSFISDEEFREVGARIVSRDEVYSASDLVTRVHPPNAEEAGLLKSGGFLLSFLRPLDDPDGIRVLAETGVTSFSVEMVPRITRAQKMDALSAMGTIGGYMAVLVGARSLPKFFPLLTTAAGTMRPAKVLILGAGVAGLQAIATARRLGAITSAYDVRPVVREEVESLGAKFVELELETAEAAGAGGYAKALDEEKQQRQIELLIPHLADSDVIISTALIPGRKSPLLIVEEAVKQMAAGSVIVDLAAPNGGNCELTVPGETVSRHGVTIHGITNLPSEMPIHASSMYSRTLSAFILEFVKEGVLELDFEDDIIKGACVTHDGRIVNERVASLQQSNA